MASPEERARLEQVENAKLLNEYSNSQEKMDLGTAEELYKGSIKPVLWFVRIFKILLSIVFVLWILAVILTSTRGELAAYGTTLWNIFTPVAMFFLLLVVTPIGLSIKYSYETKKQMMSDRLAMGYKYGIIVLTIFILLIGLLQLFYISLVIVTLFKCDTSLSNINLYSVFVVWGPFSPVCQLGLPKTLFILTSIIYGIIFILNVIIFIMLCVFINRYDAWRRGDLRLFAISSWLKMKEKGKLTSAQIGMHMDMMHDLHADHGINASFVTCSDAHFIASTIRDVGAPMGVTVNNSVTEEYEDDENLFEEDDEDIGTNIANKYGVSTEKKRNKKKAKKQEV